MILNSLRSAGVHAKKSYMCGEENGRGRKWIFIIALTVSMWWLRLKMASFIAGLIISVVSAYFTYHFFSAMYTSTLNVANCFSYGCLNIDFQALMDAFLGSVCLVYFLIGVGVMLS